MHPEFDTRLMKYPADRHLPRIRATGGLGVYETFRNLWARLRLRGSASKSEANCSVIAPASCSTSVIVTARS